MIYTFGPQRKIILNLKKCKIILKARPIILSHLMSLCPPRESLEGRVDHKKNVILPKAKHEWLNLRFQDYKSVSEYNPRIFGIISMMVLCGKIVSDHDMIEKILQTFHPGNVIMQQQYRIKDLTR